MKFGVVGWGLRGKLADLAHRPDQGHELVALADPSEAAQSSFAEAYPSAKTFSDYRKLLELDLDAVLVLSPDWLHEEHACAFLKHRTPVFLEKPMAISVESCDRILEAQRHNGTKLYVGHNMRHFGFVTKMKEWIDQGLIGEVKTAWCRHFISYGGDAYFRDWHADRSKSTGLLLQKGAHDLDILHFLCGGYADVVTGIGGLMVYGTLADRQAEGEAVKVEFRKVWPPTNLDKLNPVVDVEDVSMVLMQLQNGVLASYQQCHFTPDAWRNYTIIGTKGRIENFGDAPGKCVIRLWDHCRYDAATNGDLEYRLPDIGGWHGGSDDKMINEFLNFLEADGPTSIQPQDARMAVAVGVAATESIRSGGRPVRVR